MEVVEVAVTGENTAETDAPGSLALRRKDGDGLSTENVHLASDDTGTMAGGQGRIT